MPDGSCGASKHRKVLVLHPEPFVRDSVLAVLAGTADLECIGVELNGHEPELDAVLVGFHWLDRDAVSELRALRRRLPKATLVAVVRTADERHLAAAAELDVVVVPTAAPLTLALEGLRGHDAGPLDTWHREATRRAAESHLSPRELEVLRLLADGLTSDTIARRLGITTYTCRDHLKRLRAKLDCSTTLQAVVIAARLGMLPGLAPAQKSYE